jgi:hypothetical protein
LQVSILQLVMIWTRSRYRTGAEHRED